ncbi:MULTISPECIES: MalY/PatB family protein [Streptococcus]|uniref:cysteine-S-conjugate beta-lyase n=1 Tax=Streptococcus oralis TaxID=1303 RepID=A0A7T2ZMT6_STROR|nr:MULTISPECIES: MalY/PatB family protein [Streptococcus]EFA24130.1 putative hemolysin [Streptococcus sp. M143]MCY7069608.1 pyridoxal phosphate-dependent aminotransferase [Streptococcus oralis]MCY7090019.1 pyridoxal phosphate-dependent aminotransferase [Streptococcus oralis]ORO85519.1 cysteine desulfurase [Streptococcus oralis subsp. dentisani]QPS97097.1 pyridoxal phosphate-dependent aminotransferase [Streptococcus oralis]
MGKYDFTSLPNRFGHHTYKWKEVEADREVLPAWIADMDFVVLPEVRQAVQAYADQLVYGYTYASDALIESVQDWEATQHGYYFDKDVLVFIEGVVPAISTAIQAFTKEGEAVLINTPVYPPFARSVKLNNRRLITNSLVEKDGLFEIDFDQLEKDLVEEDVKLYILCNPHNPGGRVWEKEVLEKIGQLCQKHCVLLVSDEIHQDLALFGHKHQSFNTIDPDFKDFALILSSATKTFNIAGTKNSYAVIENPKLRVDFQKRQLANNQHEISGLGYLATEAAYHYGKDWLGELKEVIEDHINYVVDVLSNETKIKVMKPQGTYLIWLDFSDYDLTDDRLQELLKNEAKVILNRGLDFGEEGTLHARLNVAMPKSVLEEVCQRIVTTFATL